jgi:hypothetical protein
MSLISSLLFFLVLAVSTEGFSSGFKVTNKSLKLFDKDHIAKEEAACLASKDAKVWLQSEIKNISGIDPKTGTLDKKIKIREKGILKVAGAIVDGTFASQSPGTRGKEIQGPLVDVHEGTLSDLNHASGLEGSFWLTAISGKIPNLLAIAIEAKTRKSQGLIIYGDSDEIVDAPSSLPLPVYIVSEDDGEKIKSQLKKGSLTASLDATVLIESTHKVDWVALKMGSRQFGVGLLAQLKNCNDVAEVLGLLEWQKSAGVILDGTTFGFATEDDPSVLGPVAEVVKIKSSDFDYEKTIKDWITLDQDMAPAIGAEKVIKQNLKELSSLQGLIDKDKLKQYQQKLQDIQKVVSKDSDLGYRVKMELEKENLVQEATNLKCLMEARSLAQRGLWDKALVEFQKISDYQWADQVSYETFLEFKKYSKDDGINVTLWEELKKPIDHLDSFLPMSEAELDRVASRFQNNFSNSYKSIENLANF